MIIIGYQGIGKSSVSGVQNNCIDLESSNFWHEGKRPDDWYIYYCNIAVDLSKQGFTVVVSSHKEVRDYLVNFMNETYIVCVFPELYLKDEWIQRLQTRFDNDPSEKNFKALMNAKDRYIESVTEMEFSGHLYYGIDRIDYDLLSIVDYLKSI